MHLIFNIKMLAIIYSIFKIIFLLNSILLADNEIIFKIYSVLINFS